MDLQLAAKVVLITGGSKGIGLACAKAFGAEGARVAIASRDPAISEVAGGAALQLDARDPRAWPEALSRAIARPEWRAEWRDRSLRLVVDDDGRGMDTARIEEGIGLPSVRDRIAALRGKVQIESKPGQGTRVMLELPLKETRR